MKKKRQKGWVTSSSKFKERFKKLLTNPRAVDTADTSDEHIGLGLTDTEVDMIKDRFFFVDTHYDRDEPGEAETMTQELRQLMLAVNAMPAWHITAQAPFSEELKGLLDAVKKKGPEALRQAFRRQKLIPTRQFLPPGAG